MTAGVRRGLRRIVDALQRGLFDAIEPFDAAPAAPPPAQPAPPTAIAGEPLHHPQATREAMLDGRRVAFRLVRVRRRSIGFVVDANGLTVRAAQRVTLREIDAAVQEKGTWIVARLAEQRERAARAAASRIVWRDGATIDYLGEKLTVVLDPERTAAARDASLPDVAPAGGFARLVVGLPRDASAERIRTRCRAGCSAKPAASSPSAPRTSPPSWAFACDGSRSRLRQRAGAVPTPTARCGCTGG